MKEALLDLLEQFKDIIHLAEDQLCLMLKGIHFNLALFLD